MKHKIQKCAVLVYDEKHEYWYVKQAFKIPDPFKDLLNNFSLAGGLGDYDIRIYYKGVTYDDLVDGIYEMHMTGYCDNETVSEVYFMIPEKRNYIFQIFEELLELDKGELKEIDWIN